MRKYFIQTFGCEMNQADSEKIHMIFFQSGFVKANEIKKADVVIFNTCSVRKKGEDRVFGMVRDIILENQNRKKNGLPNILIGITGCMVKKTGMNQKYLGEVKTRNATKNIEYLPNEFSLFNYDDKLFPRLPDLDFTFRIEEIKYLTIILTHIYGEKIGNDYTFDDYLKQSQLRGNAFSASVIIQTGCDNYCSFCIVPFTRGKENSRDQDDILSEIYQCSLVGVKEISLVGQNVNSYGKQKNIGLWNNEKSKWNEGIGISPFRTLLNEIDKISGINRIRFTSSNPHDMTQDILDAHFELGKTCNYLHFALQSGNNEMLKKMNRRHTYEDFKKKVEYLRKKDPFFSISTDIIVGFSGETDEMFQDTLRAIDELEIDFVYLARYSVRPGTIASKVYTDDIPEKIKAERWHILNTLLEKNVEKRGNMMIGREEEVLIIGIKDEMFYGRTRNFKEVFFSVVPGIHIGDLVKVKITKNMKWNLFGEIQK